MREFEFENAMKDAGIVCKNNIVADGILHRFANNGRGNKDCWYVSFGMAGAFGDWSQGVKGNWNTKQYQSFTPQEKSQFHLQAQQAKKEQEAETHRVHEETAESALKEWQALAESGQSNYFDRKAIDPIGIRFGEGFIAVPLRDTTGKLWSLQKIYADGRKRFLVGGRKKACFHRLGDLRNGESIYIAEGYATGVSVHRATNQATVIAFDAGNLEPVIGALREAYPDSPITIAADNDSGKASNTGQEMELPPCLAPF